MIKEAVVTFCAEARAKSIVLIIEPLLSMHLLAPDTLEDVNDGSGDDAVIGGGSTDGSGHGNILLSPLLMHDTVAIDKSKIVQAIRNLVANAIKYSSPGSIVKIRAGMYIVNTINYLSLLLIMILSQIRHYLVYHHFMLFTFHSFLYLIISDLIHNSLYTN